MSVKGYENEIYALQTRHTSYIIRVGEDRIPENVYWGKRIDRIEDFAGEASPVPVNMQAPHCLREECASFGGMRFKESSMKVCFADGVRDFRVGRVYAETEENRLELVLEDECYPFRVRLCYEVFEEEDVIKKWRIVENTGEAPVVLERIFSAQFGLPGTGYESLNYNGRWGMEFQAVSEKITSGKKVYESFHGLTAHGNNPVFIVHKGMEEPFRENQGEVWFGSLEYSGNFKTIVEAVDAGLLNIVIGINDTDFAWTLKGGESFEAPAVYAGYTDGGLEDMSHRMHRFCRRHLMPSGLADKPLPVLYNSWYSTTFDVKCEEQIALAEKAARLGVELFVVDDGWFVGREHDRAGLGDWYVDRKKFPQGLKPLTEAVRGLGMRFGLWIEPEMVNPESRLYRLHPDWIYRYQTREVLMGRNQYILDMSRQEVREYLAECLDTLLSENDISYIKWDMNRYASEMAGGGLPAQEWKSLWHRHSLGVQWLINTLREKHPEVEFEACAAGGGRVDYGAMRRFDEYWPSDNTDPLDRLFIQENYSHLYPVKYMRAWLTDDFGMDGRKIPLSFAMHSAMCGSLGIGTDLNRTSEEKREEIKGYVETYKRIRNTVQLGELYRLRSLKNSDIQCVQYVGDGQSAVFVFLDHERYGDPLQRITLRGLKEDSLYRFVLDDREIVKSGAYLMQAGIGLSLCGDYDSRLLILEEINA